MSDNGGAAPTDSVNVDSKLDDLLSLVLARSRGEVGNDAVENALSSIVAAPVLSSSDRSRVDAGGTAGCTTQEVNNKGKIIPDEGNYDDDSEDDTQKEANDSKEDAAKRCEETVAKSEYVTARSVKKNNRERKEALEKIPLGQMGERMLITFGDGPRPDLDVLSTTLLGTRTSLQRAILDARALRRQLKDNWNQARAVATMHRTTTASNEEVKKTSTRIQGPVVDNELYFKAMNGFGDHLRYDVPCGFDVPQLEMLFPEEMGAYQRWKKMHDSYTAKSEEVPKKSAGIDETDGNEDDGDDLETSKSGGDTINGGRLNERLANFDARTNQMRGDWYLKFADVRRGSFLPRTSGRRTAGATEWKEKQTKQRGRPKRTQTSWQSLHPTSVIFLHWIGFDLRSALSPPNEETTQALGFLAYDFFGKIVEKAVPLRLESGRGVGCNQGFSRGKRRVLELIGGDQLEIENIKLALAEVDLKSLYSSSNIDLGKSAKIAQLYFGPGFEDRLELEMDEIFGSKEKILSEEEMKVRKEEETLFSEIPQLPTLLANVADVLDNNGQLDGIASAPTSKKSRLC